MLSIDAIRQFIRVHPGKTTLVAIAAVLYIAFNVWFYFFTTSGGFKTNPATTITEKIKNFGALRESSSTPERPTPSPTPLPRPTGPGVYACDPYGQCNLYSDAMRKQYCTITFADSLCLDQCGEKTKQCTK